MKTIFEKDNGVSGILLSDEDVNIDFLKDSFIITFATSDGIVSRFISYIVI